MQHIPVSKLKTFDIDDETPLQKNLLFKAPPQSISDRKSAASSIIARTLHLSDSSSDLALAKKISPITSFEAYPLGSGSTTFASSRSTLDARGGRDRERDRDKERDSTGRRRRRQRDRSRGHTPHDFSPDSDKSGSNQLPTEHVRGKRSRRRSSRERHAQDHEHGESSGSGGHHRRRRKRRVRREREDDYGNVIRLDPHPSQPKRKKEGRRKRSFRNSRILRAGYNIFFAQAGSSNSGSAYAPSTVLTSEISERPMNTLSPVSEVSCIFSLRFITCARTLL